MCMAWQGGHAVHAGNCMQRVWASGLACAGCDHPLRLQLYCHRPMASGARVRQVSLPVRGSALVSRLNGNANRCTRACVFEAWHMGQQYGCVGQRAATGWCLAQQ